MRIVLMFLIVGNTLSLHGQSWHPFPSGQSSFYLDNEFNVMLELSNDSISIDSSGLTIGYFNTSSNDLCRREIQDYFWASDVHFYKYSLDSTTFSFTDSHDFGFKIDPDLSDKESVKMNNESILCDSSYYGWFLNMADSLKNFSYTKDNKTVRVVLSKHHGVISFGGYELVGFKNPLNTVGFQPADTAIYPDLNPGDIIYKKYVVVDGRFYYKLEYAIDTITKVERNSSYIEVSYNRLLNKISDYKIVNGNAEKFPNRISEYQPNQKLSIPLNIYDELYLTTSGNYGGILTRQVYRSSNYKIIKEDSIKHFSREFEFIHNYVIDSNSCEPHTDAIATHEEYYIRYNTEIGQIINSVYYVNGQFPYFDYPTIGWYVTGYKLGGIVYGNPQTSIHDFSDSQQPTSTIYPNPSYTKLYVKGISFLNKASYSIFNLNGELIVSGFTFQNEGISVDQLPSGLYFLTLEGDGVVHRYKFQKL